MTWPLHMWLMMVSTDSTLTDSKMDFTYSIYIAIEFIVLDEETVKAKQKKDEANKKRREREKRKQDEKKQKSCKLSDDELSGEDASCNIAPPPKKKKHNDPEPSTVKKIMAYIHIQPPTSCQTASAKSKSRQLEQPCTQVKGPCFFNTNQTYDEFKNIIAKALLCKPKLLQLRRCIGSTKNHSTTQRSQFLMLVATKQ